MNLFSKLLIMLAACLLLTGTTHAQTPVFPQPMKHADIAFDGTNISLRLDDLSDADGVIPLYNYGETYTGNAAALNGRGYNDQLGWRIDGIWTPPTNTALWIKRLSADPGLDVYEGGMRMMWANHTFAPLFTADGDAWKFNNNQMGMHHHWMTAETFGDYTATYRVYIGDEVTGDELSQYGADDVSITFRYVPEPTSLVLVSLSLLMLRSRR